MDTNLIWVIRIMEDGEEEDDDKMKKMKMVKMNMKEEDNHVWIENKGLNWV